MSFFKSPQAKGYFHVMQDGCTPHPKPHRLAWLWQSLEPTQSHFPIEMHTQRWLIECHGHGHEVLSYRRAMV